MRRADRLFRIIQILRRARRPVTAAKLAEELEVTQRSIYRDMAELFAQRVPIRGEVGVGYVIDREFDMPPLMLTPDELDAAVLGAQWVAEHGDPALARAAQDLLVKIAAAVPARLRMHIAETSVGAPRSRRRQVDAIDVAHVRRWIRAGRKLRLRYQDAGGKVSLRTVWPVLIGYTDSVRVVIAWCEARAAFRFFRADRVQEAEFLDEPIEIAPSELLSRWRGFLRSRESSPR